MFRRVVLLFFLMCFIFGLLCAKLAVTADGTAVEVSDSKNSISVTADTSRGMIYDRKLRPLVSAQAQRTVAVKPSLNALLENSDIISDADKNSAYYQIKNRTVALASAEALRENGSSAVFDIYPRYSSDGLAVHTVGYTDDSGSGVSGIEKYYDKFLSDNSGRLRVICSVDALGNPLDGERLRVVSDNYRTDSGLVLTIDRDIQSVCENALSLYSVTTGAAVVLDVKTGEILAMASVPEFSQLRPADSLDSEDSPFVNRAITPYCVGSVFKVAVAAAALEKGIDTSLEYNCTGAFSIGANRFSCHKRDGHGTVDMYAAMTNSCNPYFINLALMTGKSEVCSMGEALGLGSRIELCDGWYAPSGIMPEADSLVSDQDLANLAFGQGRLLASPLQMTALYAAVANGGVYRAPSLMKAVVGENKKEILHTELPSPRRVMHASTAQTLSELLFNTVEYGLSGKAKPYGISACGKTATAQSGQFDSSGREIIQSWFCGFFPYEDPQYAVTVLRENGTGGTADCAPVFKYIAEKITALSLEENEQSK